MFAHLDAEYAPCVLYDGKNGHPSPPGDPIGIRPLFYGYSRKAVPLLFASEAINLEGGWMKFVPSRRDITATVSLSPITASIR